MKIGDAILRAWVPGLPLPQPRPRVRIIPGPKPVGTIYQPRPEEWVGALYRAIEHAKNGLPPGIATPLNTDRPVALRCHFYIARPRSHLLKGGGLSSNAPLFLTSKNYGDLDNLMKPVMDALTSTLFLHDDGMIVDARVSKQWTGAAGEERGQGAWVILREVAT